MPGRNYCWPLYTNGVNYDGRPVDVGKALGISLDRSEVEFPVLDMTPSQAMSGFAFYEGRDFPGWRGNIILGTLRATDLLRLEIRDNQVVHTEVLLKDVARVRDVAVGPKGRLYVLLENASGSKLVRLVPD
jgi:glucose/arabinose dehydrogenase